VEQHVVDGELKTLLVHRKGSYQLTGQPVLIGGTMGAPRSLGFLPDPGAAATAAAPERALVSAGVTWVPWPCPCRLRPRYCSSQA